MILWCKKKKKKTRNIWDVHVHYHDLKIIRSKEYFLVFHVVRPLVLILPSFY